MSLKFPVTAYEKYYKIMLPHEFPEITNVKVVKPTLLGRIAELGVGPDMFVKIYLKEYNSKGINACINIGKKIRQKIIELNEYFGGQIHSRLMIYLGEKLICDEEEFYIRKA